MRLYLLNQDTNNGYDTYDSAVVAAENEDKARNIEVGNIGFFASWVAPDKVKVEYLGTAKKGTPQGIILASFNAG